MDLSSHEIPIPISSAYGGGHGHGPIIQHDPQPQLPSNGPATAPTIEGGHTPYQKVKYRECLKNHAAAMGGNAIDGCGEFMPSGEEGTLEALKCSACNCHRNFHRKEIEGGASSCDCYHHPHLNKRKIIVGHHKVLGSEALGYPTETIIPSRAHQSHHHHHPMILPYNFGSLPSDSDEQEGGDHVILARPTQIIKKRFRTKFSQDQKEKMFNFAEKVGWGLQKLEESVVQQFCQEIGIKRRVLKVWMHNNKHNLAKKNIISNSIT